MKTLRLAIAVLASLALLSADSLFKLNMAYHYIAMQTIPSSPTDVYTTSVWLQSVEFIPQSSSSPTCTVQDKAGTPNVAYNTIALSANHSYRDSRPDNAPLFMSGGITVSCSDTTVKMQMITRY